MPQFDQAEPNRSNLERCLLALGADESLAAVGGRYDDDNPEMDWTWHFQMNLLELPCTVQSPDGALSTPWQMLYDLEPGSQAWPSPFELCPEEECPTIQIGDRRWTWPDDEPLEVTTFVARLMDCFAGQLSAYQLKWYTAEDGADVASIVMTQEQLSVVKTELGDWFEHNFLTLTAPDDIPKFQVLAS